MAVLYRKYRPQKLADLIGQDPIRETLLAGLTTGKIGHGYLFAGPRGSGKTSTARILAKAVNCEVYGKSKTVNRQPSTVNHYGEPCNKCNACRGITDGSYLDLIEIDAASNRGIDEIRDLRDKIKLSPVAGRFKVYIIDEVHMLTTEAFNALLKTLEEPPAHAIFILCTTAPEKLPATIISRLLRFNFKRASVSDLSGAIEKIAKHEGIKIEKEAVSAVAKVADGSFRDALSILDQLSAKKTISEKDVKAAYKLTEARALLGFLEAVFDGDLKASVLSASEIGATHDVSTFILDAILLLKKLLFIKIGVGVSEVSGYTAEELEELATKASYGEIQNLMKLLLVAEGETRLYPLPEIALTLAVCKFLPQVGEEVGSVNGEITGPVTNFPPVGARLGRKSRDSSGDQSKLRAAESPSVGATPDDTRITHSEKNAKISKKDAKSLAELEAKWGEFLAKVRPLNAHVVALLRSTRPGAFDGANLVLEVFFKFHKEKLEEPKIMNLLCEVLEEVLGKPVSLKFVLANRESRPTKTVTVSDVAEIGDDELSKMAAEIFSK